MAYHEFIIIVSRVVRLELSVVTDKCHWLKSKSHSIQDIPDIYSVNQFSILELP